MISQSGKTKEWISDNFCNHNFHRNTLCDSTDFLEKNVDPTDDSNYIVSMVHNEELNC